MELRRGHLTKHLDPESGLLDVRKAAGEYGLSKPTIRKYADMLGVPRSKTGRPAKGRSPIEPPRVTKTWLKNNGLISKADGHVTLAHLAKELGVGPTIARRALEKAGLEDLLRSGRVVVITKKHLQKKGVYSGGRLSLKGTAEKLGVSYQVVRGAAKEHGIMWMEHGGVRKKRKRR